MARPASQQPTEVELQILRILWECGPSNARQVHDRLRETKDTNYSTTVKMLAVMLEKGLVRRDDGKRPLVYEASTNREGAQRSMLEDLIQKLYDGSAMSLVMQALSSRKASKAELAELRQLLDEMERKKPTRDES